MRALLLVLLALPAMAQSRSDRSFGLHSDRRDRLSPGDSAAVRILGSLQPLVNQCTGATLTGTRGETITYSHAASLTCNKSDASTASIGANLAAVGANGMEISTTTTISFANPLTALTGWCYFATVMAPSRGHWNTGGNWVLMSMGTFGAANSWALYYDTGRTLVIRSFDASATTHALTTNNVSLFTGPRRVGFCLPAGATTPEVYLDGVKATLSILDAGAHSISAQPSTAYLGGTNAGYPSTMSVVDAAMCSTPSACRTANSYARLGGTKRVAAIGDSITQGLSVSTTYPAKVEALMASASKQADNYGVPGLHAEDMQLNYQRFVKGKGYTHVVVLGGVNNITADESAATIFAKLQALYDEVRADGLTLVPVTIMPFKAASTWSSGRQAVLASVNTSILAYCTTNGITCSDANTYMADGVDAQKLKTTYDSGDGLHPNQTGSDALATAIEGVVDP